MQPCGIMYVMNHTTPIKAIRSVAGISDIVLVGRGPPFAYRRKVGLQAYAWICSAATGIAVQSDCSVHVGPIITQLAADVR